MAYAIMLYSQKNRLRFVLSFSLKRDLFKAFKEPEASVYEWSDRRGIFWLETSPSRRGAKSGKVRRPLMTLAPTLFKSNQVPSILYFRSVQIEAMKQDRSKNKLVASIFAMEYEYNYFSL